MKRITMFVVTALLAFIAVYALAQSSPGAQATPKPASTEAKAPAAAPASKTVTGELVDTGCYIGHGAHGAKHVGCATKCIAGGMPMGILTSDGTVVLLTLNHDNPDPYNKLKTMAGKTLSVTGDMSERGGIKAIDVLAFKPAAEASSAK